MKKDIQIPEVKNVYVAAVPIDNESDMWDVYIINNQNNMIEEVMVTSKGYGVAKGGEEIKTSVMRHMVGTVSAKTAAKIETITPEVFHLNNEYWVTFFSGNQLMEKKYIFGPHVITNELMEHIPVLNTRGVVVW